MAKKKKSPRKPTGEVRMRFLDIKSSPPAFTEMFEFKLPEEKNAAEQAVMDKVSSLLISHPWLPRITSYEKFPTDHGPDFIIKLEDGSEAFAELAEIAILDGPYKSAARVINIGEYMDHVIDLVKTKEHIYGPSPYRPIYLFLYVTEEVFMPYPEVRQALCRAVNSRTSSCFDGIFLILFSHEGEVAAVPMRPSYDPDAPSRNAVRALRKLQMLAPDQTLVKIVRDDSEGKRIDTTIHVPFPEGADKKSIEYYIKNFKPKVT